MDPFAVIYIADITPLTDERFYSLCLASVSQVRREKIEKYRFQKDRFLSLGAACLLQHAWREFGSPDAMPNLRFTPSGKPYWEGSSLQFNLSHSGTKVLCAISEKTIGCDVEKISNQDTKPLAARFFSESEQGWLIDYPENESFFRVWTLKESFIKALGTGLSIPLDSYSVQIGSREVQFLQKYDSHKYLGYEWMPKDGYCYSCCLVDPPCSFFPEFRTIFLPELYKYNNQEADICTQERTVLSY